MKVLQITKKFPYPLMDGESWAVIGLASGLKENGASIDLFSINTDQHNAGPEAIKRLHELNLYDKIDLVNLDTRAKATTAFFNLLSSKSYHAQRFDCETVRTKLDLLLLNRNYDVVLFESVFMMSYVDAFKFEHINNPKILLRTHNVEHLIWERYALRAGKSKSWYFGLQSDRLRVFEKEMLGNCDAVLSVSEHDKKNIQQIFNPDVPIVSVPVGINTLPQEDPIIEDRPFIFGFIGSLDWRPNLEGLRWFFKEVWSNIQAENKESVLMVAGRNAQASFPIKNLENVNYLGEIEDSDTFLKRIDVLIAPLLSGSGTRVKILQALRVGTPVIASTVAAEGLNLTNGKDILIADNVSDWISAFNSLCDNEELRETLIKNGLHYLEENHDIDKIGKRVMDFIGQL